MLTAGTSKKGVSHIVQSNIGVCIMIHLPFLRMKNSVRCQR